MKVSLLITVFQRDNLLEASLQSVVAQNYPDLEIIIINDGQHCNTEAIAKKYGAKYIFTGQRNIQKDPNYQAFWRVPGFAVNVGAKAATGDVIVLSCAEMYHVGNCLEVLCDTLKYDDKAICIPRGIDASKGYSEAFLKTGDLNNSQRGDCKPLKTQLPFLMAIKRKHFMAIRGYDEDFVGYAFDDNDFVDRLLLHGCHYIKTPAQCIHLFHNRAIKTKVLPGRFDLNRILYQERKGIVVRNLNREWGING